MRPGPDPKRVEETTWMTKEDINKECMDMSQNWIETGSGRLGRLFVEILKCDDLPNLDSGGFADNKTDAFVALVFEDTVGRTDVIDDTLSPHWMPWHKRAFVIQFHHSSSQLFLGVFDYDISLSATESNDTLGRVSIDLTSLRRDTMYTLTYNIYNAAKMSQRRIRGRITVRLRMEVNDERQLMLGTLEPPPHMYVNSKNKPLARIVRYTCTGQYNIEKYSMKTINS
jgi:hypothetical protein